MQRCEGVDSGAARMKNNTKTESNKSLFTRDKQMGDNIAVANSFCFCFQVIYDFSILRENRHVKSARQI